MTEKTIDHRLAWLAGIIDGEGWIGFGLLKQRIGRQHRSHGIRWNIEVCNTEYSMLEEIMAIADTLGVHVKYNPRAARPGKRFIRKPQGRVAFNSKEACRIVLEAVFPYLVVKRSQAALMLRALQHRAISATGRYPERVVGWIPPHADDTFLEMSEEIREMNRRGVAPIKED